MATNKLNRKPKKNRKYFCKTCCKLVYYRWSASRNTYVCEKCDYDEVMQAMRLLFSEEEFLIALDKGDIP